MSQSNSRSMEDTDQNDFENEDLITIELEPSAILLHYSQLVKYSGYIRKNYIFSDAINVFPQDFLKFQMQNNISSKSLEFFSSILNRNFDFTELTLTYIQCTELIKISKFLEMRKFENSINDYIKVRNFEPDFIIQSIQYELQNEKKSKNQFQITVENENLLSTKIDDCFDNEKFGELPIHIIYHIIEKASTTLSNDKLCDFILKSIQKFYILFSFLNLEMLSNDRFQNLIELYSDEKNKQYFHHLQCNLTFMSKILNMNSNLQEQLNTTKREKSQIQEQLNTTKREKSQIQEQLTFLQVEHIIASVKYELVINAQIAFASDKIDLSKCKYIISTDNSKTIGIDAYKNGENFDSLRMTHNFLCKPGTYYVRCLVYPIQGNSFEFISNPVTTIGNCALFDYIGQPVKVLLPPGKYKLEVWGAQGGDSTGTRERGSPAQGGLGGYSKGTLILAKSEMVYVVVGEQGKPGDPNDGVVTKGGFPDGGSTTTGHSLDYNSVPGTGGGSTSISISENLIYSRIIVAGGGGGASGDPYTSNGGFGGGSLGGNAWYEGKIITQGAGTQIGSSCGKGSGSDGQSGKFGRGANGGYRHGSNSGGAGGGGWWGGGSGGYGGNVYASSGGGGSGWIFTESTFNSFKLGDKAHADEFKLNSSYYLIDAETIGSDKAFPNVNGNGNERGHRGNGFAKITIQ